jgi:hypothetical protein
LAVSAIDGWFALDVDVAHPVLDHLAGLDGVDDEHGMFRVLNIDASSGGERRGARHNVINIGGELDSIGHLFHRGFGVG